MVIWQEIDIRDRCWISPNQRNTQKQIYIARQKSEWELELSQSHEIKDKSTRTLIVIQALKLTIMIVYIYVIEKIPS